MVDHQRSGGAGAHHLYAAPPEGSQDARTENLERRVAALEAQAERSALLAALKRSTALGWIAWIASLKR